jgi:ADP-ribose pyrophosphatase YjhB (NUDIX family)
MSDRQDVKKIGPRQFLTGHFAPKPDYLSPDDCGVVFDNFVVVYVNCILVVQRKITKILVVKRTVEPWPDWWIPGGKMAPGESFEETVVRNLKRQLGLAIEDRSKFHHLGTYAFIWDKRAIPLIGNGCHIVSVILILEVSDKEANAIKLNDEYCDLSWVEPEVFAIQAGVHKGLSHCIWDFINEFVRKKREI